MAEAGEIQFTAESAPAAFRPSVVIVTDAWRNEWEETAALVRLVGGALALSARVTIVSLDDRSDPLRCPERVQLDGAFTVYSTRALRAHDERAALLRTAFTLQPGSVLPERAVHGTLGLRARLSAEALSTITELRPDVVVLAGSAVVWSDALPVGPGRPRVVLLPLCGDDPILSSAALGPLLGMADAIGVFSEGEHRRVADGLAAAKHDRVHHVRVALPVNHLAAMTDMAGMRPFGPYVLMISGLVHDPVGRAAPPHDFLREVFGDVAIAEVGTDGWVVTGGGDRFDISWTPSRMILWRLMAGAEVTVDLRDQGPVGREAIESMRFGTPIVVPDRSVAAEHAAASNGGLWYLAPGEMTDCVATLLSNPRLRETLALDGRSWAERLHGDTAAFVEAARRLTLGD